MKDPAEEARRLLSKADTLPFGRARTALTEQATEHADAAGIPQLQVEARLELVEAYEFGGEGDRAFVPFSRLVATYDAHPGLFDDDDTWRLLWRYKAVVTGMTDFPQLSRERIEAALADMERRYLAAGEGMEPVAYVRYRVVRDLDGAPAARSAYDAWAAEPRTRLSNCEGCIPTAHASYLASIGEDAAAVEWALPVIMGEAGCTQQPQSMVDVALAPLVRQGHDGIARDAHLMGLRPVRRDPTQFGDLHGHLVFCADTGNEARGLDLLEEHLPFFEAERISSTRMWLSAAAVRLLRRVQQLGGGTQELRDGSSTVTVDHLAERLADVATGLAGRFDARNGNTTTSTSLAGHMVPSPEHAVSLGAVGRRSPAAPPAVAEETTTETTGPFDLDAAERQLDAADLAHDYIALTRLERSWSSRRTAVLAEAEQADPGDDAATRRLRIVAELERGSASLALLHGDREQALTLAANADRLYSRIGDTSRSVLSLMFRARIDTSGQERLARLAALATQVPAEDLYFRAAALVELAQAQYAAGDDEAGNAAVEQGLAALERHSSPDPRDARKARTLKARLHLFRAESATETATVLAEADTTLALLEPGEKALTRAGALLCRARGERAGGQEAEALASAQESCSLLAEWPAQVGAAAHIFVAAELMSTDPARSAEILTDLLPAIDSHGSDGARARIRYDLAFALRVVGRPLEAAEIAEDGLRLVNSPPATPYDALLPHEAALAAAELGEWTHSQEMALRSAEAWEILEAPDRAAQAYLTAAGAAEQVDEPALAVELYDKAAEHALAGRDDELVAMCRRYAALPCALEDVDEALARLDAAEAHVRSDESAQADRQLVDRELSELREQRARVLSIGDRNEDALACLEGLEAAWGEDLSRVYRVQMLRGSVLLDADRDQEAVEEWTRAAERARSAGHAGPARQLGLRIARALDAAGRGEEAQAAWDRYSGEAVDEAPDVA